METPKYRRYEACLRRFPAQPSGAVIAERTYFKPGSLAARATSLRYGTIVAPCSLAASRGVETETEVVKYLLAGADVVMTASALLRMVRSTSRPCGRDECWLQANGFESVDAGRGLKDATQVEHVDALLRAQYVAARTEYLPAKLLQ